MKDKPTSHFKVFVDEHSPDESQQIQEQWQRTKKQQRTKKLTRVLVGGAIAIGLIFAIMLNIFLTHTPPHLILDNSDPDYTYIQTSLPHLKILVSKKADSYQAKAMRAIGMYQGEVISWIEGWVRGDMKVLYVANATLGVNLIGMAVGYYVRKENGGRIDMVIDDEEYRVMTEKNIKKMEEAHNIEIPYGILKSVKDAKEQYDLVVIESDVPEKYDIRPERLVLVTKNTFDRSIIIDRYGSYKKYSISQGTQNQYIRSISEAKWITSYSLKPYQMDQSAPSNTNNRKSSKYELILLLKDIDRSVNVCQEEVSEFKGDGEYLRNVVEFFRNKTANGVYYGLPHEESYQLLKGFKGVKKVVGKEQGSASQIMQSEDGSGVNYYVVSYSQAMVLPEPDSIKANLIVQISTQDSRQLSTRFSSFTAELLLPNTNQGCFYPPHLLPSLSSSIPHYLIFTPTTSQPQPQP